MSRELSTAEKKLLSSKVPKALGQGRKSYETKTEANDILQKAGYKTYFSIDPPTDHKDKKPKLNGAGPSRAPIVAKAASKSKKDVKTSSFKDSNIVKVQAAKMLIELDPEFKLDVAKIIEDIIVDNNDELTTEAVEACKLLLKCDDSKKDYVIDVLSSMLKINETEPSMDFGSGKRLFDEKKDSQTEKKEDDDDN